MCKCILRRIVFLDETPRGASKNDAFGEQRFANVYKNLLFCDKTPRGTYKNYALENSGAQVHIKTCLFFCVLYTLNILYIYIHTYIHIYTYIYI